jgi:hypothetical protein
MFQTEFAEKTETCFVPSENFSPVLIRVAQSRQTHFRILSSPTGEG